MLWLGKAYVKISVLVQSRQSLERSFNVFSRKVALFSVSRILGTRMRSHTNAAILDDPDEPPITVAIVQKYHSIAFRGICLAFNGSDKRM